MAAFEMFETMRKEIQRLVGAPELARNRRGQIKAALRVLPRKHQDSLACDFVEHALESLFDESSREKETFVDCIEAIRQRMRGDFDLEGVLSIYKMAIEMVVVHSEVDMAADIGEEGNILRLLKNCCLQRELQEEGRLFHRGRYQPSAADIADQICHRIAHVAGGPHWNSDDASLKREARQRGRAASEAEARWQFARILDSVS